MGKGAMALVERKRLHGWTLKEDEENLFVSEIKAQAFFMLLSKDKPEKKNFKLAVNVR